MINEREEFLSYTIFPKYSSESKQDTRYLGRFTFDILSDFIGFQRVLTIIARGYMFEGASPDIERARRALCAWCSVLHKKSANAKNVTGYEWRFATDFKEYHTEFPELVDADGNGWICRHVKNIREFIRKNPVSVSKRAIKEADESLKNFNKNWATKVVQFQIEIFSLSTKMPWLIRFDDILADSLELGPLRNPEISLSDDIISKIECNADKNAVGPIKTLIEYYVANKQADTDWVVMPSNNFDAYFGNKRYFSSGYFQPRNCTI